MNIWRSMVRGRNRQRRIERRRMNLRSTGWNDQYIHEQNGSPRCLDADRKVRDERAKSLWTNRKFTITALWWARFRRPGLGFRSGRFTPGFGNRTLLGAKLETYCSFVWYCLWWSFRTERWPAVADLRSNRCATTPTFEVSRNKHFNTQGYKF